MRLTIIGARLFDDYELLRREVISRFKVSEIIKSRTTPENITTLTPNEVVVQYGTTGRGYEPSLEEQICKVWIAPQGDTIYGLGIFRFVKFAIDHPELKFYVTPIEGYEPNKVAVWFRRAVGVSNIHLPQSYWDGIEYAYKHYHFK